MRYGLKGVSRRRDDALTQVRWERLEHLVAGWCRDTGYAVEHSAMDRLISGTRRRGSDGIKVTLGLMAAKAVFSLIVLAGAFFLLRAAIDSVRTAPSVPQTPAAAVVAPRPAVAKTTTASNPCHEVIDHFSGTYIDQYAKGAPCKPLSEAKARASRHKADAAMELLPTRHGRCSQAADKHSGPGGILLASYETAES